MRSHLSPHVFLAILTTLIALSSNTTQATNDRKTRTELFTPSRVISTSIPYNLRVSAANATAALVNKSMSPNDAPLTATSDTAAKEIEARWIGGTLLHKLREKIYAVAWKINASPRFMYYLLGVALTRLHLDTVKSNIVSWLLYAKSYSLRSQFAKKGLYSSESGLYEFLRKTNSATNLAAFFRLLRKKSPYLSDLGVKMEKFLISSPATGEPMRQIWLRAGDTPHELFKLLHLEDEVDLVDSHQVTEWLIYSYMYKNEVIRDFVHNEAYIDQIISLLKTTKSQQELELVFQSLHKVEDLDHYADEMAAAARRLREIDTWVEVSKHPEDVYYSLNLPGESLSNNSKFIQWLRYIDLYKSPPNTPSFSTLSALNIVVRNEKVDFQLAALFESIKKLPYLRELAEKMQYQLFTQWATDNTISPFALCQKSDICAIGVPGVGKYDLKVRSVAAYVKVYAKISGTQSQLDKVTQKLDNFDVYGAAELFRKI